MESSQTWIANLAIQDEKLRRESWYNTFFAPFSGFVDISKDDNGNPLYRPSGKPIEMMEQPVQQGRDNILIPFLRRLSGAPVYGDNVLKGTGEQQVMWWMRAYVNQTRKAVEEQSGRMSYQRQKLYKLYQQVRPQLVEWWSQYNNQEIARSFYEGVSQNLSKSKDEYGLGLYKRYHANWYYTDGDVLTHIATTGGGMTTDGTNPTAAQIDTAVAACDSEIQGQLLRQYRVKLMQKKIPQIVTASGHKFWVLILSPNQIRRLYADSDFKAEQREAYSAMMLKQPEINMAVAYYAGFAIFEDIAIVRGWDNAAGGFFGDDDANPINSMFEPSTITDNAIGITFGNNAIARGIAEPLGFTREEDDHGNIKEVGSHCIDGFNRTEFVSEDDSDDETSSADLFYKNTTGGVASGFTIINQSSALLMTNPSAT
jgi:hypothetical protein